MVVAAWLESVGVAVVACPGLAGVATAAVAEAGPDGVAFRVQGVAYLAETTTTCIQQCRQNIDLVETFVLLSIQRIQSNCKDYDIHVA